MKKLLLLSTSCLFSFVALAQVGINTNSPAADLDVQGDVLIDEELYIENPGNSFQIRGSKFLILSTDNEILEYDIEASKYGPINYARFAFTNTSTNGLRDYNTKISATDYIVTVQGYYFTAAGNNTNVLLHSTDSNSDIEGYQIYSYVKNGVWYLKAFANDSTFRSGSPFQNRNIDIFLNLIIYRKGFIAKTLTDITMDMDDSETGSVPLPTGF